MLTTAAVTSTLAVLRALRDADPSIGIVDLSRNFGKEIALTAGLDHTNGDAVVIIDADLQDPPELIPKLLERWCEDDVDVIYAQRSSRAGESQLKKLTALAFYRALNAFGNEPIPVDTGDFRILSRRAVVALRQLRERHRFMKGLFSWIGFRQAGILYERDARFAGTTKWNYWRLWNFSIEGITSFTITPLKTASYVGIVTALVAFFYGLYMVIRTIIFGNPVAGYPSLLVIGGKLLGSVASAGQSSVGGTQRGRRKAKRDAKRAYHQRSRPIISVEELRYSLAFNVVLRLALIEHSSLTFS